MKTRCHPLCTPRTPPVHRGRAHSLGFVYLLLVAVLTACTPVVPPFEQIPYRNPTAPIGVTSRYEAARFAGLWHVRGAYPLDAQLVEVQRLGDHPDGPVWELVTRTCPPGRGCQKEATLWRVDAGVPGADVLRASPEGATRRAVVLWIDDGYRTAAVGDAAGRFAWVLDRSPRGGADRIKAARQVLEFAGFDLTDMRMRP